ncbi:MAG: CBS domain-containing protein [Coriobacteriia bacterium]
MSQLRAKDIMSRDPATVAPGTSVKEAARIMVDRGVGALPVLDEGQLVGIVTESDLIMQDVKLEFPTYVHLLDGFILYPPATAKFEEEFRKAVGATVADVMTPDPVTVAPDASVEDVATLMVDRDVSRIPVVDGDTLVGIITKHDIVASLLEE